ncbi:hypothetical protein A2379_04075 [Candidatus Amesbacteria bacterium RIFOXYB1_FULL_47_13]|nr:MAG: hypothetical protein A2379_04075 [Candidatus Amesbacteria bacterium RIFOXYB1_FULL_47_13]
MPDYMTSGRKNEVERRYEGLDPKLRRDAIHGNEQEARKAFSELGDDTTLPDGVITLLYEQRVFQQQANDNASKEGGLKGRKKRKP